MAARRRRMVRNGSPTGRLRSRAGRVQICGFPGFAGSNDCGTSEVRYILTRLEAEP